MLIISKYIYYIWIIIIKPHLEPNTTTIFDKTFIVVVIKRSVCLLSFDMWKGGDG